VDEGDFISIVAEILEVDPSTVALDSDLDELDWDSLSNISFIAEIDDRTGRSLSADALSEAKTVGDLYALVRDER